MSLDLAREGRLVLTAVALLTRVPVPVTYRGADWLSRSAKYLPLVGAGIGLAAAAVLAGAGSVWPRPIPEILASTFATVVTGALHEDGLADTFDGSGGATAETRLEIMKDSRLGTFGALALLAALAIQLAALAATPPAAAAAALIAAHAGARLVAVMVLATQPHAGPAGSAKLAAMPDRPRRSEIAVAAAFGALTLLPLAALAPGRAVLASAIGGAASGLFAWRACRALGGQTGDVLGAAAVVFVSGFLLGAAASSGGAP